MPLRNHLLLPYTFRTSPAKSCGHSCRPLRAIPATLWTASIRVFRKKKLPLLACRPSRTSGYCAECGEACGEEHSRGTGRQNGYGRLWLWLHPAMQNYVYTYKTPLSWRLL